MAARPAAVGAAADSLFFKVNSHRLALKEAVLTDPPAAGDACSTPLARLVITNRGGRIALKVRLAAGQFEGVMVSSWHPRNPAPWSGRSSSASACCLPRNVR